LSTAVASPVPRPTDDSEAPFAIGPQRRGSQRFFAAIRWLHIYLSMFGFTALLFFGATGVTLNHPTWFGSANDRVEQLEGRVDTMWLTGGADAPVDKLAIVEFLRAQHGVKGAVAEFRVDEAECLVTFKGPGYSADAFVERSTGHYDLTVSQLGAVALLNDLHKGRDSGTAWSVFIDAAALLMVVSAVTGLVLLLSLKRRRAAGLVTAVVGTIVLVAVFVWLVP
jgi:hypothetical protein